MKVLYIGPLLPRRQLYQLARIEPACLVYDLKTLGDVSTGALTN
jgi:hypothetical protein